MLRLVVLLFVCGGAVLSSCKNSTEGAGAIENSVAYGTKVLLLNEYRPGPKIPSIATGRKIQAGVQYEFLLCDRSESGNLGSCKNPFQAKGSNGHPGDDMIVFIDSGSLEKLKSESEKRAVWLGWLNKLHQILGFAGVGATVIVVKASTAAIGATAGGVAGTVVGPGAGNVIGAVAGFAGGLAVGVAAGTSIAAGHGFVMSHTTTRWVKANKELVKYFADVFELDGGLSIRNADSRSDIGFVMRGLAGSFGASIKSEFMGVAGGDPLAFE